MFLKYNVSVVGAQNVSRALASMERRFRQHNQRMRRTLGTGVGARAAAGGVTARAGAVGVAEARAAKASEAKWIAAEQRLAQRRLRERQKVAQAEGRAAKTAERKWMAAEMRLAQRRRRNLRKEALARERMALKDAAMQRRYARATVGGIGRSAGGVLRGVGGLAMGALAIGGGFAAAGAIGREHRLDLVLRETANQAFQQQENRSEQGPNREQFYKRFRATSVAVGAKGLGAEQVAGGIRKFGELTGEHAVGADLAQRFGDISTAYGAQIEDVAATAGESMLLLQQRGIKGADALKELDHILMVLANQGKKGSIEFADFATIMAKVGASVGDFTGMAVKDIVAMNSAFAQLGKRGGAASAEEAGTALMRMKDVLKQKGATIWADKGIDVYRYAKDEQGEFVRNKGEKVRIGLRNPLELFMEAYAATKGDIAELQKMTNIRGEKVVGPVMALLRNLGKGDLAKGIKETNAIIDDLMKPLTESELRGDVQFVQQSRSFTWRAAKEKFEEKLGPKLADLLMRLLPSFEKLIPLVEKAADVFVDFVDFLVKNPFSGLGAIVGAAIVKDLVLASVGAKVSAALVALLTGVRPPIPGLPGGPVPVPGAVPGAVAAGAGGLGLALGVVAANVAGLVAVATGPANPRGLGPGAQGGSGAPPAIGPALRQDEGGGGSGAPGPADPLALTTEEEALRQEWLTGGRTTTGGRTRAAPSEGSGAGTSTRPAIEVKGGSELLVAARGLAAAAVALTQSAHRGGNPTVPE